MRRRRKEGRGPPRCKRRCASPRTYVEVLRAIDVLGVIEVPGVLRAEAVLNLLQRIFASCDDGVGDAPSRGDSIDAFVRSERRREARE